MEKLNDIFKSPAFYAISAAGNLGLTGGEVYSILEKGQGLLQNAQGLDINVDKVIAGYGLAVGICALVLALNKKVRTYIADKLIEYDNRENSFLSNLEKRLFGLKE